jgi:hypothetical protein
MTYCEGALVKRLSLGLAVLALAACATTTPEQWQAKAESAEPWELCYRQINGGYSATYGQAVSEQIRRRGVDCREHMAMVQAKLAADGVSQQQSLQMLQLGQQLMNQPRLPQPSGASATYAPAGSFSTPMTPVAGRYGPVKSTYISGFNRICIYGTPMGDATTTIAATSICPSMGP